MATNAELLKEIQAGMEAYRNASDESMKGWMNERKAADNVIRKVFALVRGHEFIDKVESFVGRRIMQVSDSGRVTIMDIDSVLFEKWAIVFSGKGVTYTENSSAWEDDRLEVKYSDIDDDFNNISFAEDIDIEEVVRRVEEAKRSAIEKSVSRVSKYYDGTIKAIRDCFNNPVKVEECGCVGTCECTDKLGEICQWSWRELIREFGSDEQKAEVFRNDCNDEVENVG